MRFTIKGRRIIVPTAFQNRALKQLHFNHMCREKTMLLACESIYWVNMNADIDKTIENCSTYLDFQAGRSNGKKVSHKIPGRLRESV